MIGATDLQRLLVEATPEYGIFAIYRDGTIASWNTGAERITGWTAAEIIGRAFATLYPAVERDAGVPERDLDLVAREDRCEAEGWRMRRDHSVFWASLSLSALRSDAGELLAWGAIMRDLTERQRDEESLRRREERLRVLVQSVTDYAIIMLDRNGRVVSWNEGAERITGYTRDEILGHHFSIFYPAEERDTGKPGAELHASTHEGRFEDESWRVRKDGTWYWANVVITPLLDDHGRLMGFAKVTRDLTERREAEEKALHDARRIAVEETARAAAEERARELAALLERLRAQALELERKRVEAETANRAKGEFLAAMSHELRTPLNAIGGYAELLEMELRGPITDAQRLDLQRIRRSQQHLLGIINDLLNFSRIEAGKISYDIGRVPLDAVIDAVRPMIEPQASARRIEFMVTTCAPDAVALADAAKVEQVLLNLLSNAVKFTDPGGRIELSCKLNGDEVALAVCDTGAGIPADRLGDIFEPFVQIGRSLSRNTEGTGLGLSISRELARAMGGDLTVRSTVGQGSTFTVALPAAL